ncbi:transketolase [Brenneria goodwinii]|uniref:Transketolase n=1 Tax=Brenneria goodwinii TaxID=1109412 RepID=A0A0G4JYD2_9GAMM|nr:transketolase [Brenneria goodwinii]ATA23359.1 transketolase [Brenneria goodwinii]MCG8157219.1 transketolase [Brenneria goodwinii]MCG8163641.1 transketolase [Brenneria goodwinii]MCG8166103.1 transketolase [Brenneria goodwinii]MCG8170730.1 transketolase [Brenneria goodwinii]
MSHHEDMQVYARNIRVESLKAFSELGFGHVGGVMSAADLLGVLYGGVMKIDPKNPQWEDRDYFVMSKGHAGPGLYAALALRGYFPLEELKTINTNGTRLPSHCDRNNTPGIDMTTGSLGQGMSTGIGIAHGNKILGKSNYTYLLLGDGECQEGQIWEGALYAPQQKLSHLIAFIDYNKQQLDGYTKDICDLGDLRQKFNDFGWYALEVDGHDIDAIVAAIELGKEQDEKPVMIVLHTHKGKGCNFAEGILYNHHMTFTKEQCDSAIAMLTEKEC